MAAYTEKNATYVNTEGRVQRGRLASYPPGEAREDWKIIRALSEVLGKPLSFNSLQEVRKSMVEKNKVFASIDTITPAAWGEFGTEGTVEAAAFRYPVENFYLTDPISRASETMAKCSEAFVTGEADENGKMERTGTDA